jgi:PTS system mannose-specific IID component
MEKGALFRIFLRSLFIAAALNFRRMQNLGFAYAMMPEIRKKQGTREETERRLTRHLQMFNTHPYLSSPLIGSLVRMEEEQSGQEDASSIEMVRQSLPGPYAAIGDTFFWGALRPCAGIVAAALSDVGWMLAPLAFILIYTPAHIWVRARGFLEGYRRGKLGLEFIRGLDLPRLAGRLRWLALGVLSVWGGWLARKSQWSEGGIPPPAAALAVLAVILVCWILIRKGISQVYILYGAALLFFIMIATREWLIFWK